MFKINQFENVKRTFIRKKIREIVGAFVILLFLFHWASISTVSYAGAVFAMS